jgi:putative endopeptidase
MRISIVSVLVLLSCGEKQAAPEPAATAPADPYGITAAMDPKADPCVDFYEYACGGWEDSFELPPDRVSWTRSFSEISLRNETQTKTLLEDASAGKLEGADAKKIGDHYAACMDEAAIDARGAEPLKPLLAQVDGAKDLEGLMKLSAAQNGIGAGGFFGMWVEGDYKQPDRVILYLTQGGLSLPDRDYYLGEDGAELRAEYEKAVAQILGLAGQQDAAAQAKVVLAFETELAKIAKPRDELRDPDKTYNKVDLHGLEKLAPQVPWKAYFATVGVKDPVPLSVEDPEYFQKLGALVAKTPVADLRTYLRWHLVLAASEGLSKDFVDARFAFFGQKLFGQKQQKERWKRCVDETTWAYPEIVGKYYVEQSFPGSSKDEALDMIRRVEGEFEKNLPSLAWMDDATRARALEKAKAVSNKVGYPDTWRDYSTLSSDRTKHFENRLGAWRWEDARQLAKVGGPVDRGEWYMPPSMVNAYYDPAKNEIAFPAGILQPPFFSKDYPAALNYGAVGVVVGHELTHGFDDQGRKFDPQGRLSEWWAPEVASRFEERAECVVKQYDAYTISGDLKVNGELTLGENIADHGGVKQAYQAYKTLEKEKGLPQVGVAGLTNDQLVFVAFAQAWCSERTPEIDRMYAAVDSHSPPRWRVNGSVSNLPAFHEAFSCDVGTPMHPADTCEVW